LAYPKNIDRWSVVRTTRANAALAACTAAGSPHENTRASANTAARFFGARGGRAVDTSVISCTTRVPSAWMAWISQPALSTVSRSSVM
jgi:hypothetical protein